ncbi:MAG: class I SAM-dependent methyltransferase [Ardenticatenales bacterium]
MTLSDPAVPRPNAPHLAPPDEAAVARWKRQDATHHDREADRYDALIGREFAPYQRLWTATPWAAMLKADGARVVLDVGCGTGRTALPIAGAGAGVIALDMSRGMLLQAVAKGRAMGLDDVWPLIADAEHLPLADGVVDAVVCQGVLHHLPDVATALREMDRVVAAEGRICVAEPDEEASLPYRAVAAAGRIAAALLRALRTGNTLHSPGTPDERPLDPDALIRPLGAMGYAVDATYLVHLPVLYRFLPRRAALACARAVNRGDRSRRRPADIVIVRARRNREGRGA